MAEAKADGSVPGIVEVKLPTTDPVPAVFDSPHSGIIYPTDFNAVTPIQKLRQSEDAFIDELYGAAPENGATLVACQFSRAYIDPNRAATDLDASLLDGPWPDPLKPTEKTNKLGIGLVWRLFNDGSSIYNRKLSIAEVKRRIDVYYRPYRAAVEAALDATHRRFGRVYHIDCHSMFGMSSVLSPDGPGRKRPDFVLGDRWGTSCGDDYSRFVKERLEAMGYSVAMNDPYAGGDIVFAYGKPDEKRHSLQIEINRSLFMDEIAITKHSGFSRIKADLTRLVAAVCDYAKIH